MAQSKDRTKDEIQGGQLARQPSKQIRRRAKDQPRGQTQGQSRELAGGLIGGLAGGLAGGSRSILFYKPYDVLSQFTNPEALDCQTLKDFIEIPGLYSVGRLDRDSEGLLLLTNQGAIKHRLGHPQFRHPRTYWVQVEHWPTDEALSQLRRGIVIKGGYHTAPAEVRRLPEDFEAVTAELPPREPPIRFRKTVPTAWLELTLTEGKNRQVRRMTAAVGHPTLRLVRSRIGLLAAQKTTSDTASQRPASQRPASQLTLNGLGPGQWRELSAPEQQALRQVLRSRPR